jgi:hypothetical protein
VQHVRLVLANCLFAALRKLAASLAIFVVEHGKPGVLWLVSLTFDFARQLFEFCHCVEMTVGSNASATIHSFKMKVERLAVQRV